MQEIDEELESLERQMDDVVKKYDIYQCFNKKALCSLAQCLLKFPFLYEGDGYSGRDFNNYT